MSPRSKLLLLTLLLLSGCSKDPVFLYNTGRMREACDLLKGEQANSTWSDVALNVFAACRLEEGDAAASSEAYAQAVAKNPYVAMYWNNWAIATYQLNDLKKTRQILATYGATLPGSFKTQGLHFLDNIDRELSEPALNSGNMRVSWLENANAREFKLCATFTADGYDHLMRCKPVSGKYADLNISSRSSSNLYASVITLRRNNRPVAVKVFRSGAPFPTHALLEKINAMNTENGVFSGRKCDRTPRTVTLMIDSADWPTVNVLRSQGHLPTLDAMVENGNSGVLISKPAFTSVAMRKMLTGSEVRDWKSHPFSTLWFQLSALPYLTWIFHSSSVGGTFGTDNIFEAMAKHNASSWILYMEKIFLTSKAGEKKFTLKDFIGSGENPKTLLSADKDLRNEAAKSPAPFLSDFTASQSDHALRVARAVTKILDDPKDDSAFIFAYFNTWDTLSHAFYNIREIGTEAKNWKVMDLAYRLLDQMVGEVQSHLCEKDNLVVVSDHGSLGTWQHHPDALWIAQGPGLPEKTLNATVPIEKTAHWFQQLGLHEKLSQ